MRDYLKRIAYWVQDHNRQLSAAKDALDALHRARQGGLGSKLLAGVTIGGAILRNAAPWESAYGYLTREDYIEIDMSLGHFLCNLLNRTPPEKVLTIEGQDIHFWHNQVIAATFDSKTKVYVNGPYVKTGCEEVLLQILKKEVWGLGSDLMMEDRRILMGYEGNDSRYYLSPMPELGPCIDTLDSTYYANRLKRYGNQPRTVMIEGPTRVGKSVFARRIAKSIAGTSNTLKIDGERLSWWGSLEFLNIIRFLQPRVLLIDDLDVKIFQRFLSTFEILRIENMLTIITRMVHITDKDHRTQGDRYVEGMGPGRVDELISLYAHNGPDRDKILRHFYEQSQIPVPKNHADMVVKSKGLTMGYLKEFVKRLEVHGEDEWEEELKNIFYFAPPLKKESKGSGSTEKCDATKEDAEEDADAPRTSRRIRERLVKSSSKSQGRRR